jgi:hypothetical protein
MSPKEVQEYREKYGNVSNLLLRSNQPAKIKFAESHHGQERMVGSKHILDMTIDSYKDESLPKEIREIFRANMRRIVSIFHDQSGDLGLRCRITKAEKKMGMLNGIFIAKPKANQECHPVVYKSSKVVEELLPAVFTAPPPSEGFTDGVNLWRGDKVQRGSKAWDKFLNLPVDDIRSKMTVVEWLQTPWHYEYLPFQPMNSVFKDGETYCNGCTRCSRPFYDYPYLYASYWLSEDHTGHWVHQYWRRGDRKDEDYKWAPEPFHEEDFWSKKEVMAAGRAPAQNVDEARSELHAINVPDPSKYTDAKGYHNWPTHAFLLGWVDGDPIEQCGTWSGIPKTYKLTNANKACGKLAEEWMKRVNRYWTAKNDPLGDLFDHHKRARPFTFRKYISHTWDPERELYTLVQGVVRTKGARISYGMQGYNLMRSIKYGNVCRDCQATLDMAPKLYLRTGRVTAQLVHFTGGQVRPGSGQLDTWWLSLAGTRLADKTLFDPWFIYVQTPGLLKPKTADGKHTQGGHKAHTYKQLTDTGAMARDSPKRLKLVDALSKGKSAAYKIVFPMDEGEDPEKYKQRLEDRIEMHLDAVARFTRARSCLIQDEDKENYISKVIKPPEVYVQKYWDRAPTTWKETDERNMRYATKLLERIIGWLDETYEGKEVTASTKELVIKPDEEEMGRNYNRALRDALHDTHYLMSHMSAYKREPTAPKFDPDMERVEERDYTDDKTGEEHCLYIKQLVTPAVRKRNAVLGDDGEVDKDIAPWQTVKGQVIERVFTQKNSDWDGDKHATKHEQTRQIRKLTQSRLFLTYSLHRRVKSELEARAVLEKMADAVRVIFGNDEELCRLVVFGMRLRDVGGGDSVSSKAYIAIDKPRKESTIFYGKPGSNSYVHDTYQTHVESVTVDAGMEIGPTYHHPHFHALVTINHWSYVQLDTFRMKAVLEQMFKGTHRTHGKTFQLIDGAGLPFYTDNENPYIDIRVYPSDNWAEVVAAYVRKGADKDSIMAMRARTGDARVQT